MQSWTRLLNKRRLNIQTHLGIKVIVNGHSMRLSVNYLFTLVKTKTFQLTFKFDHFNSEQFQNNNYNFSSLLMSLVIGWCNGSFTILQLPSKPLHSDLYSIDCNLI